MTLKLWKKLGTDKILVSSEGKLILCDVCPCNVPIKPPGPLGTWFCGCDLVRPPTRLLLRIQSSGTCGLGTPNIWEDFQLILPLIAAGPQDRLVYSVPRYVTNDFYDGSTWYFAFHLVIYGFDSPDPIHACQALLEICMAPNDPDEVGIPLCTPHFGYRCSDSISMTNTLGVLVNCPPMAEYPYVFPMHPVSDHVFLCCTPPFVPSTVEADITIEAL